MVEFAARQDAVPQANPATLATEAGVKTPEMTSILASARSLTAALRTVDRDLTPPPGQAGESLFRYHRRRQEVSEAEVAKLKAQIPASAWRSFLNYLIETTAIREKAIRNASDIKPIAPGAPGGPRR